MHHILSDQPSFIADITKTFWTLSFGTQCTSAALIARHCWSATCINIISRLT